MNMSMNNNRYASINRASLENQYYANRRRNNRNYLNSNINNDSIGCNYNKMKILILIIITFIMSLSHYFYSTNNDFNLVEDEPRTILSFFGYNLIKLYYSEKKGKLRNLKQAENEETVSVIEKVRNNTKNYSNIYQDKDNETIPKLIYKNIIKQLFNDFDKYDFKCKWKSIKNKNNSYNIYNVGDNTQGEGFFNIKKKIDDFTGEEYIVIVMKNKEDKYIDNWILHTSISSLDEIFIDKNINNTFEIEGNFLTTLYKGELFNIINEENLELCKTYIKISFPLDDQTYINNNSIYINNLYNYDTIKLNPNNFSLFMESSCGFIFDINF